MLVMYNPASTKAALSIHFSKRWLLTYQSCVTTINVLARPPKTTTTNAKNSTRAQKRKTYKATADLKHLVIPGLMCKYEPMGTSEMSNWDLMISTCFSKLMKGGASASVSIIRSTWTFSSGSNALECKLRNSGVPYTLSQK